MAVDLDFSGAPAAAENAPVAVACLGKRTLASELEFGEEIAELEEFDELDEEDWLAA